MEELTGRPFPPGEYPVVIVGTGPGGLQLSYSLRSLGIRHALLSADEGAGGMFRKWPLFQRMLSWTKPFTPVDRQSVAYERYDWNSLIPDDDGHRGIQAEFMDGTSYFPPRQAMQANLEAFAERTALPARFGCRWESTRAEGDGFVIVTSDGEYRCRYAVFAVGVAEPWRPPAPGMDAVPHYGEISAAEEYRDKRVFIVGKKNSGFEIANGLLHIARQLILGSPSPARTSLETRNLMGVRARYAQPFEDSAVGGGVYVIDVALREVVRQEAGFRILSTRSDNGEPLEFDTDAVIAATGFQTPLLDLPALGVGTYGQSRLPQQTAYWESGTVPGIFFAGTISQGAQGLKKYGISSNSGAVHGHRYNARVLAEHLATQHFGVTIDRPVIAPESAVDYLLDECNGNPAIFHQRSYLARVVGPDPSGGLRDEGIQPLQHFLDSGPDNRLALTLEANSAAEIYPAVYVRAGGRLDETLLEPDKLLQYGSGAHRRQLDAALQPVLKVAAGS